MAAAYGMTMQELNTMIDAGKAMEEGKRMDLDQHPAGGAGTGPARAETGPARVQCDNDGSRHARRRAGCCGVPGGDNVPVG